MSTKNSAEIIELHSKVCCKCKQIKSVIYFSKNKTAKDKLAYNCKLCAKQANQKWKENNPEKYSGVVRDSNAKRKFEQKLWHKNNQENVRASRKKWRENNPEKAQEALRKYEKKESTKKRKLLFMKEDKKAKYYNMKSRFKLTKDAYEALISSQGDKCAICRNLLDLNSIHTHIDHCHNTNRVRGILCKSCNNGLGFFKDSKQFLLSAIEYLKRAEGII